jgi:hypothetical protein
MDRYPTLFPKRLEPIVDAAILKVRHAVRNPHALREIIAGGCFAFAEIASRAADDGEWRVDLANSGIDDFINLLCTTNPSQYRPWCSNVQ